MRMVKKREMEKEWRQQEAWERRRERKREIVMQGKKYFVCRDFGHIFHYYRNRREIEKNKRVEVERLEYWLSDKKFEVLTSRVIKTDISNKEKEKKEILLKEVIVKIELKQEDKEERITVEVLLDSGATELVMSSEFSRKNKFKNKKPKRLIYVRNIDNIFNHEGQIEYSEGRIILQIL